MELKAVVAYKGARAHYFLRTNCYSIWETTLASYEGAAANQPPAFFLLLKNGALWLSSLEEELFTEELGRTIDQHSSLQAAPFTNELLAIVQHLSESKVRFVLSPDKKTICDFMFSGHWRCSTESISSGLELAVPFLFSNLFSVTGGVLNT